MLMTDLEKAKEIFYSEDYSFVLVKNEDIISSSQKGIMQIVELIESGKDFTDYSMCDRITGRAVAFLYVIMGLKAVHSVKMTKLATNILDRAEIKFSADEYIEKVLDSELKNTDRFENAVIHSGSAITALEDIKKELAK